MSSKKRKAHFSESLQAQFSFIRAVNNESTLVQCIVCNSTFSIASGGKSSITDHIKTQKHKTALAAKSQSGSINNYYRKLEPSKSEYDLAIHEGTYAYHTIRHNQSFRSMDCTTSLQKKFSDKKFSCSRTKCEAIVKNVFYPWSLEEMKNELKNVDFVTLSCDTSNHKYLKLLPITVRYFDGYNMHAPINNKVLTFVEISGETADIISSEIMKTIASYELDTKVIGLSADNTNTNFGGLLRRGTENVITKLKTQLNRNIIGLGCNAHIVHNCAKAAFDSMPIDIEVLVTKIFGYFHIYTVRVERLKDFCDFVGQEYKQILGYANVRWLSLLPALERILKLYPVLKSFFMSENQCPKVLKQFFDRSDTELWISFAHSQAFLFHDTIKMLEGNDKCATESALVVKNLLSKMETRRDENFIPHMVKEQLTNLVNDGNMTIESYFETSKEFYDTALSYLKAWNKNNEDLSNLSFFLLNQIPLRENFDMAIDLLSSECQILNINCDELFDEFTYLRTYLSGRDNEWFNSTALAKKWCEALLHMKENNVPHANMKKVVSLVMCLPGSNAFVERVFSCMNYIWSDEKSQLKVETMRAILAVKINMGISCEAFSEKISANPAILKQIHSSDKYTAVN